MTTSETTVTRRRPRADGQRSRDAILKGASELATIEGLEGLSIGRLADHIGMSKSGLYAHFGSKEELQLATIDAAQEIFEREVVNPALEQPEGLAQVLAYSEAYLSYLERHVFPGGCFFAAASAEVDTHKGRVRDRISEFMLGWIDKLHDLILAAQKEGSISPLEDPTQLAYELEAAMMLANNLFVLTSDPATLERGRRAVRRLLAP